MVIHMMKRLHKDKGDNKISLKEKYCLDKYSLSITGFYLEFNCKART